MPRITEDTVNDLMSQYLRECGLKVLAQETTPFRTRIKKPDFWLKDGGFFLGEGEWDSKKWVGLAQARDYSGLPEASGAFLIAYPEQLKRKIAQTRLSTFKPEEILSGVKYSLAFLRPDTPTALKGGMQLENIPSWLNSMIEKKAPIEYDPSELIRILRQAAKALTSELSVKPKITPLFRNLLSGDPIGKKAENTARMAAGYLLLNQIAFYRVLSHHRGYSKLTADKIQSPSDLQGYFNEVLKDDYYPIFSFGVVNEFGSNSLPLIKQIIKMIYSVTPEYISQGVLGKVFHELIPLEVRKPVAAYYTLEEAAKILAELTIEKASDKIMDPACGSGTLLAAAYDQKKKKLPRMFKEVDHKRFLEKDITGIDIMAFAAHLSTIHLAIQGPIFETDKVRIAIHDSTTLNPGDKMPSISFILPRARIQRKMDDFRGTAASARKEMVKAGIVSPGVQSTLGELQVDTVDTILMNPPFTRFQRLATFDENYTQTLANQFLKYSKYIDRRMPYSSYFIFLADRFLDKGGRIGAVLPATMLRGDSTSGFREFLTANYQIEFIIIREDRMNFSEDTNFREILLVAKKGDPTETINYIMLRNLDPDLSTEFVRASHTCSIGGVDDYGTFEIRKKRISQKEVKNLFLPISLSDHRLLGLIASIFENGLFIELKDLAEDIQGKDQSERGGPTFSRFTLNAKDSKELGRDFWQIGKVGKRELNINNLKLDEQFSIPKHSTLRAFRRIPYRDVMDVSSLDEYVISQRFDGIHEIMSRCNVERINWRTWHAYLESRLSNLALVDRFDVTAPGSSLISYFSSPPRVWARIPAVISGLDDDVAKSLCAWFNSTIGFIQILTERMETRGGWMQLHKYIMNELLVPNFSEAQRKNILDFFQTISSASFPSLVEQFALLTPSKSISRSLKKRLSKAFGRNLVKRLGKGFALRETLDRTILQALGWKESDIDTELEWIYPSMLREILILREIMVGR
jgi:hypothetical protein